MTKEEIDILVPNICNLAESNVFENLKMFVKAMKENNIPQEQLLTYFEWWLDMTTSNLNKRLEESKK